MVNGLAIRKVLTLVVVTADVKANVSIDRLFSFFFPLATVSRQKLKYDFVLSFQEKKRDLKGLILSVEVNKVPLTYTS